LSTDPIDEANCFPEEGAPLAEALGGPRSFLTFQPCQIGHKAKKKFPLPIYLTPGEELLDFSAWFWYR